MELRWELVWRSWPVLAKGLWLTLELAAIAALMGVVVGTAVALLRLAPARLLQILARAYVEFLRGTPLLVQLFLVAYGLPQILQVRLPAFAAATLAYGINSSAYVAEIVRAGIQSIHRGQFEAAYALGLTPWQVMESVILPQAFRRVLPPLVNEFATLLKNTSLVATVALADLFRTAQLLVVATYRPFEFYLAVAVVYLVLTVALSQLAHTLERRWRVGA